MKNLQSEAERIASQNIHEILLHRAERLVVFLKMSVTPKEIIAEEIFGIFVAGMTYCGRRLGASFWKWMNETSNNEPAVCLNCAEIADKTDKCSSCKNSLPVV